MVKECSGGGEIREGEDFRGSLELDCFRELTRCAGGGSPGGSRGGASMDRCIK